MDDKIIESKIITSWGSARLVQDVLIDGGSEYIYVDHPGSVVMVPFVDEKHVVLVEQYRHPVREISLEFPAGGLNSGEKPEVAAKRELSEEVGCEMVEELVCVGEYFPSNGTSNERVFVYRAKISKPSISAAKRGNDEIDRVVEMSFENVLEQVYSHRITDGLTIVSALLVAKNYEK